MVLLIPLALCLTCLALVLFVYSREDPHHKFSIDMLERMNEDPVQRWTQIIDGYPASGPSRMAS